VSYSNKPPTPKSHEAVDVAEVEGVEGVGGVTSALTCSRKAAANPPNGKALDSVDLVGLYLLNGADRACPARFPCYQMP
jgi:hypothetical protein